jgi:hypothetical protein
MLQLELTAPLVDARAITMLRRRRGVANRSGGQQVQQLLHAQRLGGTIFPRLLRACIAATKRGALTNERRSRDERG